MALAHCLINALTGKVKSCPRWYYWPSMAQLPRVPDLEAQRVAMKKVGFLVGKWAGEARLLRGPAESVDLLQTEEAHYKLGGLILVIEGVGLTKSSGQPVL